MNNNIPKKQRKSDIPKDTQEKCKYAHIAEGGHAICNGCGKKIGNMFRDEAGIIRLSRHGLKKFVYDTLASQRQELLEKVKGMKKDPIRKSKPSDEYERGFDHGFDTSLEFVVELLES